MKALKLVARRLAHAYGANTVFSDVTIDAQSGEVVAIIGPNGAGKSTLVRILAGIEKPRTGTVRLDEVELRALDPRHRARRIGVLLEAPDATFGFTARELVLLGRYPHLGRMGFASDDDLARADDALMALRLEPLADRPYPTLSSGERQRVGLARLVCQAPAVMLLDEPTSRLDPQHALHVAGLLRGAADAGRIVIAVVHDLDLAAKLADRVVVLAEGGVIADGPPGEVLTPALIQRVWHVRARRVDEARPAIVLDPP